MQFEWDQEKEKKNIEKHGISFTRAITIFASTVFSIEDIRKAYGEIRIQSFGMMQGVVVIMLAHTDRNGIKRIISARVANKKERSLYHDYIKEKKQNCTYEH